MPRSLLIIILLAGARCVPTSMASSPQAKLPAPSTLDWYLIPDRYLVDIGEFTLVAARCASVTPLEIGRFDLHFEVTHVYAGSSAKPGDGFSTTASYRISDLRPELMLSSPPNVGDRGLWVVARDPGTHELTDKGTPLLISIDDGSPAFGRARELAGDVESYYNLSSNDRLSYLLAHVRDPNIDVAQWSVDTYAFRYPDQFQARLADLLKDPQTVQEEISIDSEMSRLKGDQWRGSPERAGLLNRWATAKPSLEESRNMANYLHMEAQLRGQLHYANDELLITACFSVALNEHIDLGDRQAVIQTLGMAASEGDTKATDALREIEARCTEPQLVAEARKALGDRKKEG